MSGQTSPVTPETPTPMSPTPNETKPSQFRLSVETLAQLDQFAAYHGLASRTAAIRMLAEHGVKGLPKPTKRKGKPKAAP